MSDENKIPETETTPEEPVQAEPVQEEPVHEEPVQVEPVQEEPVQVKAVQVEAVQVEPVQVEPVQVEAVQEEPEQAEPAQEEAEDTFTRTSASLDEELSQLRDTFQTEYDKAAQAAAEAETEAAMGPEIQALDDDEPNDEPDTELAEETAEETKKAERKKNKLPKKVKALIVVLVLVCTLIVVPLLSYFIITLQEPSFNSFVSAYAKGLSATSAAEQISYYTEALGYTADSKALGFFTQELYERIAVATSEADGYAAAMSYVSETMTEDMLAAPKTKEFKSLLSISEVIEDIAAGATEVIAAALGDDTDTEKLSYEDLALTLGTPDAAMETVTEALQKIAEGMVLEKTAETKEDLEAALQSYLSAYNLFNGLGATAQSMLEDLSVKLYDKGFAYEAALIIEQYFTEDMLSATTNAAFTEMQADLEALKGNLFDPAAAAETQVEAGKTEEADFIAAVAAANTGLSEKGQRALALLAQTVAEGMAAENARNLTKANTNYTTALSAEDTLKLPTAETAKRAVRVSLTLGDTAAAHQLAQSYVTEAVLADAPEDFKALHAELTQIYNAQDAVNDTFYPFYYSYLYYGGELDKEEITAALDEMLTEDADYYTIAFVNFYKYLTEAFTDGDYTEMQTYLTRFADAVQDYPMLYASSLLQLYLAQDETEKAVAVAKQLLEINIADDLGNSVLSLEARMKGDVSASLDIATRGIELSGTEEACAHQAAIDYLLLDNYRDAFDLAYRLYEASLTVENCETLKIIAVTYTGDDASLQAELDSASAEIDDVYENYGVTYSEDAQAVIDGTKTPADIFLAGSFDLR